MFGKGKVLSRIMKDKEKPESESWRGFYMMGESEGWLRVGERASKEASVV